MNEEEFDREVRKAAARVAGGPAPRDLHDRVAAVMTTYPGRSRTIGSLHFATLLGGAAAIGIVLLGAAFLLVFRPQQPTRFVGATTPASTPVASPLAFPDGIPRVIDGQPVLRPAAALARAATATDDRPFLVGGWTVGYVIPSCALSVRPTPTSPLAPRCPGGWTLGETPGPGTGAANLWNHLRDIGGIPLPVDPGAVVIRVHAHDPAAAQCAPGIRTACEQALVIEAVVWQAASAARPSTAAPTGSPEQTILAPCETALGPTVLAKGLAEQIIASQPNGTPTAAAYVETTIRSYAASLPDQAGLPRGIASTNDVLIVEVDGWFPASHRGPPGADTTSTSIVGACDATLGSSLGWTYVFDPTAPGDHSPLPTASDHSFAQIRQFGAPVPVPLGR